MLKRQLALILLFVFSAASAHALDVYTLVTKSCRFYSGESVNMYMNPETGGYTNPLLASPIGRLTYWPNFKKSALEFQYAGADQVVKAITDSPDLDRALNACYGIHQEAKLNFLFFMNALPVQAKADAFVVTIASFAFVEGALAQIASRLPLLAAIARTGTQIKIIAGLVFAEASFVTAKALVRLVQLKRHTLHDHEVAALKLTNEQEKQSARAELASERHSTDALQDFALRDLERNIATLKVKAQTVEDPARRAQLNSLIVKSERALWELKAS